MDDVTFFGAYKEMWARTFDYKGTSGRKEYWYPFIVNVAIALVISVLFLVSFLVKRGGLFFNLAAFFFIGYLALSFLPWISLTVRRLRDSGRSGWWTLLVLILGVGMIILLILCTSASTIYNFTGGGYNPGNNMEQPVYGPPSDFDFDPVNNEQEEVYGPPDFEWESEDKYAPQDNEEPVVYGPPEMFEN